MGDLLALGNTRTPEKYSNERKYALGSPFQVDHAMIRAVVVTA